MAVAVHKLKSACREGQALFLGQADNQKDQACNVSVEAKNIA